MCFYLCFNQQGTTFFLAKADVLSVDQSVCGSIYPYHINVADSNTYLYYFSCYKSTSKAETPFESSIFRILSEISLIKIFRYQNYFLLICTYRYVTIDQCLLEGFSISLTIFDFGFWK